MIWIITLLIVSTTYNPIGYSDEIEVVQKTFVNRQDAIKYRESVNEINTITVDFDSCDIWCEDCRKIKRDALMNAISKLLE